MQTNGRSQSPNFSALTVVHLANDLRNLLAVMAKCTESIRARLPPDHGATDLAELEGAIDSAFYISREMFGVGRPQRIEPRVVDLNELVSQAHGVLARILSPDISVELRLRAIAPMVEADAVQVEWVLLNLVANARDAMPGGGTLTIETSTDLPADVAPRTAVGSGRYVRLTVSDTGGGIMPEVSDRVFEPFFTTRNGTVGLGLTSVAVTVRGLRGWLHIKSNDPSGTHVHVYLPLLMAKGG